MRHLLLFILLLALGTAPGAAGELPGTCSVAFVATSTLHDVAGTAACTPFTLMVLDPATGAALLGEANLSVPVAGMQTGIERRDRAMREMFEAGRFPQIVGRLPAAPLIELRRQLHQAAQGGTFPLQLRIRDHEQTVAAQVSQLTDTENSFSVELRFPVSLAAYGLKPPSVLGFIRVGDEVRVKVSVQLAPLPTRWQP